MPSFFKKLILGKELSNPYVNRYHPGHISTGAPNPTSTTRYPTYPQPAEHFPSAPAQPSNERPTNLNPSTRLQPRSAIPIGSRDYLGEARMLAGRDPVTGRPLAPQAHASYAAVSGQALSPTGQGKSQSNSHHVAAQQNTTQHNATQQPLSPYQEAQSKTFTPYPEAGDTTQWEPRSWHTGEVQQNPYVTGGDAAMGRPVLRGSVNHAGIFVQEGTGRKRLQDQNSQGNGSETGRGESSTADMGNPLVAWEDRKRRQEEARAARERAAPAGGYFAPERPVVREYYAGSRER